MSLPLPATTPRESGEGWLSKLAFWKTWTPGTKWTAGVGSALVGGATAAMANGFIKVQEGLYVPEAFGSVIPNLAGTAALTGVPLLWGAYFNHAQTSASQNQSETASSDLWNRISETLGRFSPSEKIFASLSATDYAIATALANVAISQLAEGYDVNELTPSEPYAMASFHGATLGATYAINKFLQKYHGTESQGSVLQRFNELSRTKKAAIVGLAAFSAAAAAYSLYVGVEQTAGKLVSAAVSPLIAYSSTLASAAYTTPALVNRLWPPNQRQEQHELEVISTSPCENAQQPGPVVEDHTISFAPNFAIAQPPSPIQSQTSSEQAEISTNTAENSQYHTPNDPENLQNHEGGELLPNFSNQAGIFQKSFDQNIAAKIYPGASASISSTDDARHYSPVIGQTQTPPWSRSLQIPGGIARRSMSRG